MANPFKYRADQAGSLVLPEELKNAREQHAAGSLDSESLTEVENRCIDAALRKQADSGIDILSDGEFRRDNFTAALQAAGAGNVEAVAQAQAAVIGREAAFLQGATRPFGVKSAFKISVISPGFRVGQAFRNLPANEASAAAQTVAADLGPIIRSLLEALVASGVPYIQLLNPSYGYLLATDNHAKLQASGIDPVEAFDAVLAADQAVLQDLEHPEEVVIGQQISLGAEQPWFRNEGFDALAEKLFSSLAVDRFNIGCAEDAREADFQPLRFVPEDKIVSLGLIRSANPVLEDADWILDRLDEADEVFAQENLAVCVQPGFARLESSADETQYKKLHLAGVVARRYWGFEM